jgi:hypothetical protein
VNLVCAPPYDYNREFDRVWVLQRRSHRGYTDRTEATLTELEHTGHTGHTESDHTQAAHGLHSQATTCCTTQNQITHGLHSRATLTATTCCTTQNQITHRLHLQATLTGYYVPHHTGIVTFASCVPPGRRRGEKGHTQARQHPPGRAWFSACQHHALFIVRPATHTTAFPSCQDSDDLGKAHRSQTPSATRLAGSS